MRNFTSAVAFSYATGNLFKDPRFILRSFKQSFNTIQPQVSIIQKFTRGSGILQIANVR